MPTSIKNGADGTVAKVDNNHRLHTSSVTVPVERNANKKGDAFNVNSGVITLTDAVDTPVFYLKNNNVKSLLVTAIAVGVGISTGGTGDNPTITVIRNPTAGTIVSGATDVDIKSNRNYGSANQLTNVTAYKGATGLTMTGGEDHILFFQGTGRLFASIDEIIPQGTSIGIKFNPQTSNTSQDVYAALILHFLDDEDND